MEHDICRVNVDLALTKRDAKRFTQFLIETGRKRSPYLRQLVLQTLDDWESEVYGEKEDQVVDLRELLKGNQS